MNLICLHWKHVKTQTQHEYVNMLVACGTVGTDNHKGHKRPQQILESFWICFE